jgi:hypothetical protein
MSTNNPLDDPIKAVTEKLRGWWNRTPRAQRAYEKLSTDLDHVVAKVESVVEESGTLRDLRDKVGAAIDPTATRPDTAVPANDTPPAPPPPPPSPSLEGGVSPATPNAEVPAAPEAGTNPATPAADVLPATPVVDTTPPTPPTTVTSPPPSAAPLPDPITTNPAAPSAVTPENDVEVRRLPG